MRSGGGGMGGWEAAGRELAMSMAGTGIYAAVITAEDPNVAAEAALGLARYEAQHRRVAVADVTGDLAPLQQLLPMTGEVRQGISDSFLHGVSINKIGEPIDLHGNGNLFILPSGTEPVQDPAIYGHERWQKLAKGFKETGALLLLVAPASAQSAGLDDLIDHVDGVILVGSTRLDHFSYLNVIGRVPRPIEFTPRTTPHPTRKNTQLADKPQTRYLRAVLIGLGIGATLLAAAWAVGWL